MAANLKSLPGIGSLGKRVVNQIWTANSPDSTHFFTLSAITSFTIRSAHSSVYDKNLDDQVHSSVVPDDVIPPQSDKYWAPDPQTGVFGPASDHKAAAANSSSAKGSQGSVLEEKAWFRPTSLEDTEKPHSH
ncbi:late embryogenesis abundant protein At5g17165-like isoform X2 [Carica papaya]|uniref:late embryogenesis abundant protein At5g17165-like isoform X2 n=1 Tax=Carica papaya TaxID=3649 RepID=UPI000B8C7FAD|nr:late embryogenesis abundant protein At5g17165-like isoform X2 [Carica papaya]